MKLKRQNLEELRNELTNMTSALMHMWKVIHSCETPIQLHHAIMWAEGRINEWEEFEKKRLNGTAMVQTLISERYRPYREFLENTYETRLKETEKDGIN